jgi:F420-dependent oxidoreductase-like protein
MARGGTAVKVGVIVPQGWTGEYDGWEPAKAWARTLAVAKDADRLGFESIWLFDHFHTVPKPTDELTFESFTSLAALAAVTNRVRLGHVVICNGYRNPALVAKMIATMDVIAGGRMELGIGAGWKRDEWMAYGYGFPETRERLAALADGLGVIAAMLAPGSKTHATFEGRHAHVKDAINLPKGLQQPRVPIMVGGNGPKVTWRLAARHADELNVDGMSPKEVREAIPTIRARCEEIGRDPDDLRLSVHIWWGDDAWRRAGEGRQQLLRDYADAGVDRVMGLLQESADSDALEALAVDAKVAGFALAE